MRQRGADGRSAPPAIAASPWLRWELYVWGEKNVSYQRPVIMGFRVSNQRYNIDIDATLLGIGHRQIKGMELDEEELMPFLHAVAAEAQGG